MTRKRISFALPVLLLLAVGCGCADVSPVQGARRSRDMLNSAVRTVRDLRQVGFVNDQDYRRFYGLMIVATDAQDKLDAVVIKQARGEASGFDVGDAQQTASKALDDLLLLQAAFEKRKVFDLPATPTEGK